jgi:hypothetical protein
MKRTFATLAAACVVVAGLAAQSPAPDQAQPAATKSDKSMTVTGCLSKGADDNAYSLSAEPMKMSPDAATPSADHKMDRAKANWSLVAGGDVNFASLVGHTVEVTGSVVGDKKSADQPVGTSGPSSSMAKKFNVTSIKDVSATCTQ